MVISSTILQIHINPFLIPSSIHFHFHLINSIQTSHQHSHSHKHSIHSYPISYPYTYHPLLYHSHFISNHTSPLITLHMPLSIHHSITHHPYYSYTNFPFFHKLNNNLLSPMPNHISSKHSFTHFHTKTPPFNSTHSHYHFSFSHTSLIPHIHITTLIHTNTLTHSFPFYYQQYTLRTNTHTTIHTLNTPFTPISIIFIIYKPIPSTHTLHTLLLPISIHSFYSHSTHTLFHTSITYTPILTYSTHSPTQFHSIPSPFNTTHHTHSNSILIIPFHTLINYNHTLIPIYHLSHFISIHSVIHSSA